MENQEGKDFYFKTLATEADKIRQYTQAGKLNLAILQTVIVIEMQNEVIKMLIGSSGHDGSIHQYDGQAEPCDH